MRYPYTMSDQSVSLLFNGKMHTIPNTHLAFERLKMALKEREHDAIKIASLVEQRAILENATDGLVKVVGNTVHYKGMALHSTLTAKIIRMMSDGYDTAPWVAFLERVMANPSQRSRDCLFDFLESFDAPITEDGHFIAFKRVKADYMDIYTGMIDNSPGKIVEMPRDKVDDDPRQTCSHGLHACSISYLSSAYATGNSYRTVAVKIDPADVVSVPVDYNFAKMRVCRYEVVGDIEDANKTPEDISKSAMFYGLDDSTSDDYTDSTSYWDDLSRDAYIEEVVHFIDDSLFDEDDDSLFDEDDEDDDSLFDEDDEDEDYAPLGEYEDFELDEDDDEDRSDISNLSNLGYRLAYSGDLNLLVSFDKDEDGNYTGNVAVNASDNNGNNIRVVSDSVEAAVQQAFLELQNGEENESSSDEYEDGDERDVVDMPDGGTLTHDEILSTIFYCDEVEDFAQFYDISVDDAFSVIGEVCSVNPYDRFEYALKMAKSVENLCNLTGLEATTVFELLKD